MSVILESTLHCKIACQLPKGLTFFGDLYCKDTDAVNLILYLTSKSVSGKDIDLSHKIKVTLVMSTADVNQNYTFCGLWNGALMCAFLLPRGNKFWRHL